MEVGGQPALFPGRLQLDVRELNRCRRAGTAAPAGTVKGQNRQRCAGDPSGTERASAHHRLIVRAVRCPRNAQTRDQAESGGPRVDDPEGIALLRDVLVEAGFTPSAVRDALATEVASGRDSAELPLYLYMLRGGGELATLIKLFLLDLEVPAAEAEEALAPLPLDRLEAMGVLTVAGGKARRPTIELVPTEDLLVACDAFQKELTRPDHVLGVSPPARVLAWLTVRAAGRAGARPRHRQRPPGAARRASRRAGHRRSTSIRARSRFAALQRRAERRSTGSSSARATSSSRSRARSST